MKKLPEELSEEFDKKWDEFNVAVKTAKLEFTFDKHFRDEARQVFSHSNFAAGNCIQHPEVLINLLASGDLIRSYRKNTYLEKLLKRLPDIDSEKTVSQDLRRFRRYEMIRIAWRDLTGRADLFETVMDLSAFADACIENALAFLYQRFCHKLGVPRGTDGSPQQLVVIGMGKLGGRELNFSSDVDLVLIYPEQGQTKGGPEIISNNEFFTRLARSLLRLIGASRPDGILFRTDMRLRPFGESGPLVMSFDAMEDYYQRQGREWERYAWIKARVVAGDKVSGVHFLKRLKPFVYRRYLDYGAFESLRLMKRQITLEEQRNSLKNNIKLGSGGIREIEFFGQVFQLIRGGVEPVLQRREILEVLRILAEGKHISYKTYEELKKAYVFLRNTEHRLQMFSDQQIHTLPEDGMEKRRISAALGFEDWESFDLILSEHMNCVHFHFDRLLEEKKSTPKDKETKQHLNGIWQEIVGAKQTKKVLADAGFDEPDKVLPILVDLKNDPATKALSNQGRERLDKLIPLVLREAGMSGRSFLNLNHIIDLIKAIERRTCYLALLTENPSVVSHLVKLADASPWIVSFLAKHPVLLDELLDQRALYEMPEKSEMKKELRKKLESLSLTDLEQQIEELCIFKQINILRVAVADITGALPLMKVSDHLTDIAEIVLAKVIDLSWAHLTAKHGAPLCTLNGERCEKGFSVVAYGKLGGLELGYDSDLDLVFLHTGAGAGNNGVCDGCAINIPQFFARLGQRVVHILTAHTAAGFLYETDMRLRPSGTAGLLVSHVDAFKEYQAEKAWTWEHQALIRARVVYGDAKLSEYFRKIRKEVLSRPRKKEKLQKEVGQIRERLRKEHRALSGQGFDIKQGTGGIVDIEFLVQYLVLLNAHKVPELLTWTDNVRILETLAATGILDRATANNLKNAYLTYRSAVHRFSLQEKQGKTNRKTYHKLRQEIIKIWNQFVGG